MIGKKSLAIVKNPSKFGQHCNQWYEEYRVTDEEELRKDNYVWQKITKENNI